MKLNYFYNTGSQNFREFKDKHSQQKILSLLTGENVRSVVQSSAKNISSFARYPLDMFFTDSFNYAICRIKEIKQDLALNPISPKFEKVAVSSRFNFKKFLIISASTFVLQLGATAIQPAEQINLDNQNQKYSLLETKSNINTNVNFSSYNSFTNNKTYNLFKGMDNAQNGVFQERTLASFLKESMSNANPLESIRKDATKAAVKIPKYMQSMFQNKDQAFLHLLHVAEGKQHGFYRDNVGIALAYGWNPTRNTKEFNLKVAQSSGLNEQQTQAIVKISNTNKVNYVPKELKKMKFTSAQVDGTALALMPFYEQGFLNAMAVHSAKKGRNLQKDLEAYHDLPNNQQAVLIHMAYKVGETNLTKYKTFFGGLFKYLDNPSTTAITKVKQTFLYSYATLKGERLQDTRVEDIHKGFFSDCSISSKPNPKEKISQKINQCRNVANLTNQETMENLRTHVSSVQTRMLKAFG